MLLGKSPSSYVSLKAIETVILLVLALVQKLYGLEIDLGSSNTASISWTVKNRDFEVRTVRK